VSARGDFWVSARHVLLAAVLVAGLPGLSVRADEPASRPVIVDRVIARWRTVDQDSASVGHLVFARELAFEARIEAMALGDSPDAKLTDRHIRSALTRHVTESLLEELPLDPPATPAEIGERAERARSALEARVGSAARLESARALERLDTDEVDAILRRTARASLYLDRMVAPVLVPTDLELRELHASGKTPYSDRRFVDVVDKLRRLLLSQRMASALEDFWQRARSRIVITWVKARR